MQQKDRSKNVNANLFSVLSPNAQTARSRVGKTRDSSTRPRNPSIPPSVPNVASLRLANQCGLPTPIFCLHRRASLFLLHLPLAKGPLRLPIERTHRRVTVGGKHARLGSPSWNLGFQADLAEREPKAMRRPARCCKPPMLERRKCGAGIYSFRQRQPQSRKWRETE